MIRYATPTLWLHGPAGVGKTTAGWQIYSELRASGIRAGFVDIDQLGMCYPETAADPGRHRIKTRNLNAVIDTFRAAGAWCVVVSGVIDPAAGVDKGLLPNAALTLCYLRAEPGELARRYYVRSGPPATPGEYDDIIADTLAEAAALDAHGFGDACVDTTGVPPAQVVELVRASCREWPPFMGAVAERDEQVGWDGAGDHEPLPDSSGSVTLLCGATGVGKSTVGFEVYTRLVRAGRTAAYVDLGQIGFLRSVADGERAGHLLRARNLAAVWRAFRSTGASHLVCCGQIETAEALRIYRDALPAAEMAVYRLTAGEAELTRRIMSRRDGGSWPEPGDSLAGRQSDYLQGVARRAAADDDRLARELSTVTAVDTEGRSAGAAADLITVPPAGGK